VFERYKVECATNRPLRMGCASLIGAFQMFLDISTRFSKVESIRGEVWIPAVLEVNGK
jgi:hypothetical protein